MIAVKNPVADAHEFLAAWAASAAQPKPKAEPVTEYVVGALQSADTAGKAVAATVLVQPLEGPAYPVVVYAFAAAAKARLQALATHSDRWETVVMVTATTNAKGYRNVKRAEDVELLQLIYRPRPVPTLVQHLGRYVVALGQRLQGHGALA